MNWSQPYSATWRIFRVNRKTWADAEKLTSVDSADVTRTADGDLIESGSLKVTGDFETGYYRIVMTAQQGGDVERVDIATLLFGTEGGEVDYGRTVHEVDGFSVLHPASTTTIVTGQYAPAGVDGAQYAAELLREAINAPVVVEGSFTLNEHLVHEFGSSVLEAAWAVLDAGEFVIQIDGRGIVHICPKPYSPSLTIDNARKGILLNKIDFSADTSEIPNRYIVMDGLNVTIAINDDPDSPVSSVSRGYYVDSVNTSPTPVNSETHAEYANRMLKKASILKDERSYKREYAPDVYPYSLVRASIDGLMGDLRVESQSISCGRGITVSERASREVSLW